MSRGGWSVALDKTLEQVFRHRDADGKPWVDVIAASAPTPVGWEVVQQYSAWPTPSNARYLVPLWSPRAARAGVSGYGSLRPFTQRVSRWGLGEVLSRFPRLLEAGRLKVVARTDRYAADALLSVRAADTVGVPDVRLGVPVRSLDPHSKPTVQLVTPAGATVGFTKIGWSSSARARVLREAAAYRSLGREVSGSLRLPTVLDDGTWLGRQLLTTAPMPTDARLVGPRNFEQTFEWLRHLADSTRFGPLGESPTGVALMERVAVLHQVGVFPQAAELATAAERLLAQHGDVGLVHGAFHGDWVPWNLARRDEELWAWDLEHWRPSAPVGLDVVLGMTQATVHYRGVSIAVGVDIIVPKVERQLCQMGLGERARHAVLDLGRLEIALRAAELFEEDRGWQTGIDPHGFSKVLSGITGAT